MAARPMALLSGQEPGFRWRAGESVSRVEGFSDAVFGFAITLLVVSLEVPKTYQDLMLLARALPAFALTFTLLVSIWHAHFIFFRRYALEDALTITLNSILLFVVIAYLYPLKFLFSLLLAAWFGLNPGKMTAEGLDMVGLMVFYGSGIVAVYLSLAVLYARALAKRDELELTPIELYETKSSIIFNSVCIVIGLISIALVLIGGRRCAGMAGVVYAFIGPSMAVVGTIRGRGRKRLERRLAESERSRSDAPSKSGAENSATSPGDAAT